MKKQANFYPWLVWFLAGLFLFYKYILQVAPGVMGSELMDQYHISGAGLGNLAACYFYSYLLMQLPAGVLLDKFSPRHLMTFAIFCCGLGGVLFAKADVLWLAQLSRMLIGFGAAFATVGYLKLASVWFVPNRFALLAGLVGTTTMLGAMMGQAPVVLVMNHLGWHETLLLSGVIGLVLALVFYLVVRDKAMPDYLAEQHKEPMLKGLLKVVKNKQNWLLALYSGLAFSPTAIFAGLWGVPYFTEAHHVSKATAALVVSLTFLGLACGGPVFGWLSDRLQQRREVMGWGTTLSLACVLLVIYGGFSSLWVNGLLLFGFGFGTSTFLITFTIARDSNALYLAATVVAFLNTADALFGGFTEPFVGKLLDSGWDHRIANHVHVFSLMDYQHAFVTLPFYLVLALLILPFIAKK